ncbi:MAG: hypothetical protein EZS28_031863, partial [Streblomastix strix]
MSVYFFRPNEIAKIRLKFSNVNKTENQVSLRLAPKQANAIETELKIIEASAYSIRYSATTELAKLGIPERVSLPLHITTKTNVLSNNTIFSHSQQEQMAQLGNQQIIQAKVMKGQTWYLNKEVRQGENGVTNYYLRLNWRHGNDLLSPYLLILPLAHPKY